MPLNLQSFVMPQRVGLVKLPPVLHPEAHTQAASVQLVCVLGVLCKAVHGLALGGEERHQHNEQDGQHLGIKSTAA